MMEEKATEPKRPGDTRKCTDMQSGNFKEGKKREKWKIIV